MGKLSPEFREPTGDSDDEFKKLTRLTEFLPGAEKILERYGRNLQLPETDRKLAAQAALGELLAQTKDRALRLALRLHFADKTLPQTSKRSSKRGRPRGK